MNLAHKATLLQKEAMNQLVVDQITYEKVGAMKKALVALRKRIKEIYDPMISKAKVAYDGIRGERDKHLKPVTESEAILKKKIITYEDKKWKEEEEARIKAEEEAKEEAKMFGGNPDEAEPEEVAPTIDKVKGTGIRRTWKAQVINIDKVPREYMMANQVALNMAVRYAEGKIEIPGIKNVYN